MLCLIANCPQDGTEQSIVLDRYGLVRRHGHLEYWLFVWVHRQPSAHAFPGFRKTLVGVTS